MNVCVKLAVTLTIVFATASTAAQSPTWFYVEGLKAALLDEEGEAAVGYFESALERDPKHLGALTAAANMAGNLEDAFGYIRRAYEIEPGDEWIEGHYKMLGAMYHTVRGIELSERGSTKKSEQEYELALEFDPLNPTALNNLAYSLSERKKELERALQLSELAIRIAPDNPVFLDTYGWILFRLGRIDEAKRVLRHAVSMLEDPEILLHYSEVLRASGETFMADFYRDKAQQ